MSRTGVKLEVTQQSLQRFNRSVNRLSDYLEQEVKKEIQYAALETETEAKRRVPVDTGNLKTSIQTNFTNIDKLQAEVYTNVEYAKFVELGTSKMRAQPYLHPALKIAEAKLLRALKNILR